MSSFHNSMIVSGIYVITFKCIEHKQWVCTYIKLHSGLLFGCQEMTELTPEGMLPALYVSYHCKSAIHILLLFDDLVVCQGAPDLQRQTFRKIKLDSAFLSWHFYAGMSSFKRWGWIASHLTFVWASKLTNWFLRESTEISQGWVDSSNWLHNQCLCAVMQGIHSLSLAA